MPRTSKSGAVIVGQIKHDPLWIRALVIIIGLLIFFSALVFMFPQDFLASGLPVQGILSLPVWLRVVIICILIVSGPWIAIYGLLS
jgi:hypothetical protein